MEDVLVLLYVDNSFYICCFHWWIIFVAVQSLVFVTLVLIKLKQKCDVELFGKHSSAANWIKKPKEPVYGPQSFCLKNK